jgi:hypothetical protein
MQVRLIFGKRNHIQIFYSETISSYETKLRNVLMFLINIKMSQIHKKKKIQISCGFLCVFVYVLDQVNVLFLYLDQVNVLFLYLDQVNVLFLYLNTVIVTAGTFEP